MIRIEPSGAERPQLSKVWNTEFQKLLHLEYLRSND